MQKSGYVCLVSENFFKLWILMILNVNDKDKTQNIFVILKDILK